MDPAAAGHFTTLQLRGGRAQGRDLHVARLVAASRALYGVAPEVDALRTCIRQALAAAGMAVGDCTLRVRIRAARRVDSGSGPGSGDDAGDGRPWVPLPASAARVGAAASALRIGVDIEPPRRPASNPLSLRTHGGARACAGIKHLALEHQLGARRAARDAGFDDALLISAEGRVLEGTFWNVVLLDGRGLVWPEGPSLPGVTQQLLQACLAGHGLAARREPVDVAEIARFSAAWSLNSTGVQDIASVDGHRYPGDAGTGELLRTCLAASPWATF